MNSLQLYGQTLWLYQQPIDFRASIDGLVNRIQTELHHNPQDSIFIFYNRHRDKIKCISWHRNGYLLCYKRLEKGRFYCANNGSSTIALDANELGWLLAGLDWQSMRDWRTLDYSKFS